MCIRDRFTLAISLHSAIQGTRNQLMPGVKKYTLPRLHEAIQLYVDVYKRQPLTFAWDVSKNLQRSYRLDRIDGCELTDDSVVAHHFTRFSAADSLREHGQSAVLIWENEQLFHSCTWAGVDRESARVLDDGRVEATVSYASEPWLFDQVLAAGGRILIAAPADLVSSLTAYAHS